MKQPNESSAETAYRRGFAQAAFWAGEQTGDPLLKAWAKECDTWRHAARFGPKKYAPEMTCPPEPWQFEKGTKTC